MGPMRLCHTCCLPSLENLPACAGPRSYCRMFWGEPRLFDGSNVDRLLSFGSMGVKELLSLWPIPGATATLAPGVPCSLHRDLNEHSLLMPT